MRSLTALKGARLKTGRKKTLKVRAKSMTDLSTYRPSVTPTHTTGGWNAWRVRSAPLLRFRITTRWQRQLTDSAYAALTLRSKTLGAAGSDVAELTSPPQSRNITNW